MLPLKSPFGLKKHRPLLIFLGKHMKCFEIEKRCEENSSHRFYYFLTFRMLSYFSKFS